MKQYSAEEATVFVAKGVHGPTLEGVFPDPISQNQFGVVVTGSHFPLRLGDLKCCIVGCREELVRLARAILEEMAPVSDGEFRQDLKRFLERLEGKQ